MNGRCAHMRQFTHPHSHQCPGRISGIVSWNPSVSKSGWSRIDIFQFSLFKAGYILWIPLRWWEIFLKFWASTGYFSNSIGLSVTSNPFSPFIDPQIPHPHGQLKVEALPGNLGTSLPPCILVTIGIWETITCKTNSVSRQGCTPISLNWRRVVFW